LQEDFQDFVAKGFTTSQIHVLCANFLKFSRPEISRVVVHYLPDKKQQNFSSLSRSRFCTNHAQNLPGPAANNVLRVPKFHPNPFTSGGVIAERVNTAQTWHKVFPILGEATASSPSNNVVDDNDTSQFLLPHLVYHKMFNGLTVKQFDLVHKYVRIPVKPVLFSHI